MDLKPGEELGTSMDSADEVGLVIAKGDGLFRWQVEMLENKDGQISTPSQHHRRIVQTVEPLSDNPSSGLEQEKARAKTVHLPASGPLRVGDAASVLRSKNAGPFELTFDVMLKTEEVYMVVKDSGVLNQALIEELYNLRPEEVIWCGWFDRARAYKATIVRKRKSQPKASGGFGEVDVHGSQQYIPLLQSVFPEDVSGKLRRLLGV